MSTPESFEARGIVRKTGHRRHILTPLLPSPFPLLRSGFLPKPNSDKVRSPFCLAQSRSRLERKAKRTHFRFQDVPGGTGNNKQRMWTLPSVPWGTRTLETNPFCDPNETFSLALYWRRSLYSLVLYRNARKTARHARVGHFIVNGLSFSPKYSGPSKWPKYCSLFLWNPRDYFFDRGKNS